MPAEADVIREAAERVPAGWSLSASAADLRGRELHGPHAVKVRDGDRRVVTLDGTPVEEGGQPERRPDLLTFPDIQIISRYGTQWRGYLDPATQPWGASIRTTRPEPRMSEMAPTPAGAVGRWRCRGCGR